uniref:Reverse transcriptase domain, reverse transcriptase zinc-binding domain protein n=1 Tax=Tanacetum cinerariifolium TaxID=118510 RepID=A0A6L2P227_TANCI|nr:reverse transcriptase domain, reverse transcriptase zinc-binding domain protein [Tanacetum cinerariifolium]
MTPHHVLIWLLVEGYLEDIAAVRNIIALFELVIGSSVDKNVSTTNHESGDVGVKSLKVCIHVLAGTPSASFARKVATCKENACNLMNTLKCFEEVAGLKINLTKSKIYGVGVEGGELDRMACYMRHSVSEFPFTYLGLPIGVNMRRTSARNGVIDRNERDALWCKLIISIYGLDGGWSGVRDSRLGGGGVWADIIGVGSRGESFWEEGDDFGVDVLRFHTCLTDILGFLEKLEWWFERDIDDEEGWMKRIKMIERIG